MPELPEVETTVRGVAKYCIGKKIVGFWCDAPGIIRYISSKEMGKLVEGTKIIGARRRAKNIIIDLSNNKSLVIHMKMTGHILYGKYQAPVTKAQTWKATEPGPLRDDPYNRFVHIVFSLGDGKHLVFCDMRKFGKIAIHDTNNLHTTKELIDLGPELWELTVSKFIAIYRNIKSGRIKQKLLDQTILAGVGNIYGDEGLWASGIDPHSVPNKIPNEKLADLFKALVTVTKSSLKTGGDSMSDYRNILGLGGKFQNFHRAYKQTGKACSKRGCSGIIKRTVIAARSTHYCPKHQRLYK